MNKPNYKKKLTIVIVAVLVAVLSVASIQVSASGSDAVTGSVNTVAKPLRSLMSSVVDNLEHLYGYLYRYDRLEAENEALKAQIATMEQEYREYIEVSDENNRLHALLGLSQRHSDYKYASATLISWTSSSWSSSFTIDMGSENDVKIGDPVVTENGSLIGSVTSVSAYSSTVTTLIDTSSAIGAEDSQTNELAVACGNFDLMKSGKLRLDYLPDDFAIKTGDTIVTSGSGGTYPQGIVLGTLDKVVISPSGMNDYAVITPAAELDSLEFVFIITSYNN